MPRLSAAQVNAMAAPRHSKLDSDNKLLTVNLLNTTFIYIFIRQLVKEENKKWYYTLIALAVGRHSK